MPTPDGGGEKPLSVVCEFCECKLTRRGQVIEISGKAKDLRKLQDRIDKLDATGAEQADTITRLERELAEARAAVTKKPAKAGGGWFDDDDDDDDE
jgi:hypothetical protein